MEEDDYGRAMENEDEEEKLWKEVQEDVPDDARAVKALLGKNLYDDQEQDEAELKEAAREAKELTEVLLNEMVAPDLLNYTMYDRLKSRTRDRMDRATDMDSDLDPLERAIFEMDANRFEFELISLHRVRLKKIAKYATYFSEQQKSNMSSEEETFAKNHTQMVEEHFEHSFLQQLPQDIDALEGEKGQKLYPKPDTKSFVIFRAKDKFNLVTSTGQELVGTGDTFAAPYDRVRPHLLNGQVTLI